MNEAAQKRFNELERSVHEFGRLVREGKISPPKDLPPNSADEEIHLVPGENQGPEPGYIDGGQVTRAVWPDDELILERDFEGKPFPRRENADPPPASWHTRFILEQRERGQVQPHLLAMLEVLLQEAEKELGRPLPEPKIEFRAQGILHFVSMFAMTWKQGGIGIGIFVYENGRMILSERGDDYDLLDAAQLATALRELFAETEGDADAKN